MVLTTLGIKDFIPLILIVAVIYMLKAGMLAAILVGIRKLWEKFRNRKEEKTACGGLFHYQIKGRRRYLTFFL